MWPESWTTTCKKAKKAARDKMEAARQLNRTVITFTIRGAHPRKDGTAGFLGKLGHSGKRDCATGQSVDQDHEDIVRIGRLTSHTLAEPRGGEQSDGSRDGLGKNG